MRIESKPQFVTDTVFGNRGGPATSARSYRRAAVDTKWIHCGKESSILPRLKANSGLRFRMCGRSSHRI
jgi:hypothetical protein